MPRLEAVLEAPLLKSKPEPTAGEEKAVEAPPSKTVKSSKSTSVVRYEQKYRLDKIEQELNKPAAFIILAAWIWLPPF